MLNIKFKKIFHRGRKCSCQASEKLLKLLWSMKSENLTGYNFFKKRIVTVTAPPPPPPLPPPPYFDAIPQELLFWLMTGGVWTVVDNTRQDLGFHGWMSRLGLRVLFPPWWLPYVVDLAVEILESLRKPAPRD